MGQRNVEMRTDDRLRLCGFDWQPEGEARAAICLIHGIGEHVGRYAHVAAALNRAGYSLTGFDQRGHGRSEGARGFVPSYDVLLEDIRRQIEEMTRLHPGKPVFLYGHSLGGNLVVYYSLRRQPSLDGVISTSPQLRLATKPPAWKTSLGRLMLNVWPSLAMSNGLDLQYLSHDPQVVHAYKEDPLVHDRVTPRLGIGLIDSGEWLMQHAAEFRLPLLLIHGSEDRLTSATATQEFAAQVPGDCTLKIWEGMYHETHNEPAKAEVIAFMINWLNRHLPAQP